MEPRVAHLHFTMTHAGARVSLLRGFSPPVFATDRAIELVGKGMPFRDAYAHVKHNIHELAELDPHEAIAIKTHEGATAGLDFDGYKARVKEAKEISVARIRDIGPQPSCSHRIAKE